MQGRFSGKAPDSGAILKDLDLDVSLKLPEDWHARSGLLLALRCHSAVVHVTAAAFFLSLRATVSYPPVLQKYSLPMLQAHSLPVIVIVPLHWSGSRSSWRRTARCWSLCG